MSADFQPPVPPMPEDPTPEEAKDRYLENPETTPDISINALHASVMREKEEPEEGKEPVPLWLILFFAILLFGAGGYLFRYCGGFDSNVFDEEQVAYGPQKGGGGEVKAIDPVALGKRLYTVNCASCHQSSGQGAAGQYPPLAGSDLVVSKNGYGDNHLVRVLLGGLVGTLNLSGGTYNGNMPAWSGNLKDDQIAYILTYIRQEWGNQAGPISPEGVAEVRKETAAVTNPWTDEDLKKIPPASLAPVVAPAASAAPAKK